jgi:hypothetical protein
VSGVLRWEHFRTARRPGTLAFQAFTACCRNTCGTCGVSTTFGALVVLLPQDRLGWFDDASIDIETIMREKGEEVGWATSAEGSEFTNAAPLPPPTAPRTTEV